MFRDAYDNTRFPGIYRGVVVDNKDPENNRRLKLQIPQVLNAAVTEWAWPVDPSNLELTPPAIGQGVWVMFEGGDANFPIWVGVFGDSKDTSSRIILGSSGTVNGLLTVENTNGTSSVDLLGTIQALQTNIDGGSA